jgi:hypothetical protein
MAAGRVGGWPGAFTYSPLLLLLLLLLLLQLLMRDLRTGCCWNNRPATIQPLAFISGGGCSQ